MENKVNEKLKKKCKIWYAIFRMCSGYSMIALGIQSSKLVSWGAACINYFYKVNYYFRQLWIELLVELEKSNKPRLKVNGIVNFKSAQSVKVLMVV